MANYKTGAQRYNDKMNKIMDTARATEKKRIAAGEKPNPNLTDTPKRRSTSDGYMPNKTRKLEVKSIGGETRRKFEGVHPVLNESQRMKASLNNALKKGDVKVKQRTAQ